MKNPTRLAVYSWLIIMSAPALHAGLISGESTTTMEVYQDTSNQQKLVIYKSVPGALPNAMGQSSIDQSDQKRGLFGAIESDKYWMWIKSAATGGVFKPCFVHKTRNLRSDLVGTPSKFNAIQEYGDSTDQWSHSYGNIEMSEGMEVEIRIKPLAFDFRTINGVVEKLNRATCRPQAISCQVDTSINPPQYIIIKINKPGQYSIDINGQLDDYNKALEPDSANFPAAHTISIFANPLMDKTFTQPSSTVKVMAAPAPGTMSTISNTDHNTFNTFVFAPGIHNLGYNFKVRKNKTYYIPGDAVVYGTLNNIQSTASLEDGAAIRFVGYGTLSGTLVPHPRADGVLPENVINEGPSYRLITNKKGDGAEINGLALIDAPYHTAELIGTGTVTRWTKMIGWRSNNDGIGSCDLIENSFFRVADDCSYLKGDKIKCIFWKDAHAAVFHMANIPTDKPILLDDCELIYNRSSLDTFGGATRIDHSVFNQRGIGNAEQKTVNVTVRNFRITDPKPNRRIFGFDSVGSTSYKGITFENLVATAEPMKKSATSNTTLVKVGQRVIGDTIAPWNGVRFENVTIAGNPLTKDDFIDREISAKDIQFATSFRTAGAGTWNPPSSITKVNAEVWGGGGAGGSASTASTSSIAYGGGAAGGCYARATVTGVTSAQNFQYQVGSGGLGSTAGFAASTFGQQGGSSSFKVNNGATLALAVGGLGGGNAKAVTTQIFGGKQTASSVGSIGASIKNGGSGAAGNGNGAGGGGGSGGLGSSGGSAVIATTTNYSFGGIPGAVSTTTGLGGGSYGIAGVNFTSPGYLGEDCGAGGGGAGVKNLANFHANGGNGGNGKVLFWYSYGNW